MSVPQTRTTVMPMPRVPILLDLSLAHATQAIQAMAVTVKTLMSVQLVRMIVIQTQPAQTAMVRLHAFVTPGTAEMVPIVKTLMSAQQTLTIVLLMPHAQTVMGHSHVLIIQDTQATEQCA